MPDTLTTDAIAQLLIDAKRTSYTLRPGGEKRTTLTLECVEMLCGELLRLRRDNEQLRTEINDLGPAVEMYSEFCTERAGYEAEISKLRADLASTDLVAKHLNQQHDAAVRAMETMRAERDAAVKEQASVGFDVTLELEVSVASGHYATLQRKLRLPVPPGEDVALFLDGDHDSFEITDIHWFEKGNLLYCSVRPRKHEEGDLDDTIAYYKTNGWTVEHEDRRGR